MWQSGLEAGAGRTMLTLIDHRVFEPTVSPLKTFTFQSADERLVAGEAGARKEAKMRLTQLLSMCAVVAFVAVIGLTSGRSDHDSDSRATSLGVQSPASRLGRPPAGRDAESCTVFFAADDHLALGGNNEDGFNPLSTVWFLPGEDGTYGRMYVGYDDLRVQGGLNDQGLFFDGLAVRQVNAPHEFGKPIYPGILIEKAMAECGKVACVLDLFDHYGLSHAAGNGQYLIGDRTGDSAIIEPFGVIRKDGRYQVATNFFQSEVPPAERSGHRYITAISMLAHADALSVDLFRAILDATHQEGAAHTIYSTVYDLRRGLVYLYYFHDFDHVVVLDLRAELAKGIHAYDIASLFPPSPAARAFGRPLLAELERRRASLPHASVAPELLQRYVGTYELTSASQVLVTREDSRLLARETSSAPVVLIPLSPTQFAHVFSDGGAVIHQYTLTFLMDDSGQVTGVEATDETGAVATARKIVAPASGFGCAWLGAVLALLAVAAGWYGWRSWKTQRHRRECDDR